jgi:hypothetical protein
MKVSSFLGLLSAWTSVVVAAPQLGCHGGLAGKLEMSGNDLDSMDLCEVAKVRS